VFFFVDAYLDRRRRRSFTRFAVLQNLQYAPEDPFGLLGEPFASLARGDDGTVENVLWGTWHETPLVVFDYRYSRRRGWVGMMPGGRSFSCAVTSVEAACKRLAIERPSLRTRLADGLGLADIRFESEAFNGAFNVKGDDERFASAFVDARMMEWLLNEAGAFGWRPAPRRVRSTQTDGARAVAREGSGLPKAGAARGVLPVSQVGLSSRNRPRRRSPDVGLHHHPRDHRPRGGRRRRQL
jgi:hypothetical protein